ncbi:ABC transporter ATP-binding protein [Phyllobacterium sp. 0TCS1.6C]|uniref:ABC transporter ATP-binding protein n=1 Tax=unclassified Phyllobacterium TaxID=2638441 RepID=UPI002264CF92|nr:MULTISPECIES: ABC transporter ATP-binding protein [unclassified Phyllobacterium]MCX8279061.1 ABC transporter ATP-binding protein [Phyllobacterium sp. 0TCS1.6C]MCX8293845.1 ABC transporter ATP-binding protein [Phyllobacterium sp. 0TCS1.6A]
MSVAASTTAAAVALCSVRKEYGRFVALDNIDLEVPAGSFCTFLGPSGSGKTTTLNIVGGLVSPDHGRVSIGEADCTRLAPDKRGLGFVFQSYALFPHMTIAKNIAYPLKLRGVTGAEQDRLVADALSLVRLTEIANRYPSELSGGQQQRVALARAFVFRPKVLLMDEPLSALDAALRAHLQREIVRITRELGCTVLYVTHDQEEALAMSDQIVLFNQGRIEQRGTPLGIYSNPLTEFAAGFVGNGRLVHGVLHRDGDACFVAAPGGLRVTVDPQSVAHVGIGNGAPAAAVFRPETISLSAPPAEAGGELCRGTVKDAIFVGGQIKVRVKLNEDNIVECRCNPRSGPWETGAEVSVRINPDNLPAVVPSTTATRPRT